MESWWRGSPLLLWAPTRNLTGTQSAITGNTNRWQPLNFNIFNSLICRLYTGTLRLFLVWLWCKLSHHCLLLLFHHSDSALVWAVSQHTGTSKNTKATFKCCYVLLLSYVEDYLQAWYAPCITTSMVQKWRQIPWRCHRWCVATQVAVVNEHRWHITPWCAEH